MTLTLEPTKEMGSELAAIARQRQLAPERLLDMIVSEWLARNKAQARGEAGGGDPTLALFAQWDAEDATDDPAEIARRQADGDALLAALRAAPLSLRSVDLENPDAA